MKNLIIRKILRKIEKFFYPSPIFVVDEYIKWLSYANAGMLNPGNIYIFDYVIKNLKSNFPIIEIGSFCGLSTNVINYFVLKYKKKNLLITCDEWEFENMKDKFVGNSNISFKQYKEFIKDSFTRNVDKFLEKGGFILFDDSADGVSCGCAKLARELCQNKRYSLVIKNPNYLFQKNL